MIGAAVVTLALAEPMPGQNTCACRISRPVQER
jgi:hypothetical protein